MACSNNYPSVPLKMPFMSLGFVVQGLKKPLLQRCERCDPVRWNSASKKQAGDLFFKVCLNVLCSKAGFSLIVSVHISVALTVH